MNNFYYSIPTKILFGKGQIENLGQTVKQYGKRVLLIYGGGSIKKIGLYNKVMQQLADNGVEVVELSGVEPNPRITTVNKGAQVCKEEGVDVVLAVGGGSTLDCAKVVAAAANYEGDAWDLVKDASKVKKVLPIITVLTLAATGSEMDAYAVISNMETNEKLGTGHEEMKPKVSILDPEYTYSVSKYQTAAGTADIMSHVFEEYFERSEGAFLQNRMAEAILKTCIKYGKIAVESPEDYEARANLMWASSLALNGLMHYGKAGSWSVHPMEHELSAFYDITHGVGLAILTPHWMKYVLDETSVDKFVEYGVNVWDIDKNQDKYVIAKQAIQKTREYFLSLEIPMSLREVGIEEEKLEVMARQATRFGEIKGYKALSAEAVLEIFKAAY